MVQMSIFGAFIAIMAAAVVTADSNDALSMSSSSSSTSCSTPSTMSSSSSTSCSTSSILTSSSVALMSSSASSTPCNSSTPLMMSSTPIATITTTKIEDITTSGPVAMNTSFAIGPIWPTNMTIGGNSTAKKTAAAAPVNTMLSSYMGMANAVRPGAVAVGVVAAAGGIMARMLI